MGEKLNAHTCVCICIKENDTYVPGELGNFTSVLGCIKETNIWKWGFNVSKV